MILLEQTSAGSRFLILQDSGECHDPAQSGERQLKSPKRDLFWNSLAGAYQTDEELWRWGGGWDM